MKDMPDDSGGLLALAARSLEAARENLAGRAGFALVREPLIDPECPRASDLDVLAFANVPALLVERLAPPLAMAPSVDLILMPQAMLEDPAGFARMGVMPHRLLTSRPFLVSGGKGDEWIARVRSEFASPENQRERITGFMGLGYNAVRETGVCGDFPEMAMFFHHAAAAALVAAMCDASGALCPNVFTRPMTWLRWLERMHGTALDCEFVTMLDLDCDPLPLIDPLRRMHAVISTLPEPAWPPAMRPTTVSEYRYFGSREELEFRIETAKELAAQGENAAAVFYLRFHAYALARMPMIRQRALEGRDEPFMRPSQAMRPTMESLCPEVLFDLSLILARQPSNISRVRESLGALQAFHRRAATIISKSTVALHSLPPWRPHEA